MIYLKYFQFPFSFQETEFLHPGEMTAEDVLNNVYKDTRPMETTDSIYPFTVLSQVGLEHLYFGEITILHGENGCGKTTALNVIAEKLKIKRDNLFNSGQFFQDYLNRCSFSCGTLPLQSSIITSDDVFAHSMNKRQTNARREIQRKELIIKHKQIIRDDPLLHSLEDYDRWKERQEAIQSKSRFMKARLEAEAKEYSNGETAISYFIERMEKSALYLIDEPENSLSFENQIKLAEYIYLSARHFNSQFIIATHSPIFLSIKNAVIYDMNGASTEKKIWTELDSVRTMYDFFKSHEDEFV